VNTTVNTQFGKHPDRIKNLHFAFVVLLRAVRKASSYLSTYPFSVGNAEEDERTRKLVMLFLDSHVLSSCNAVFSAFDESLLFRAEGLGAVSAMSVLKRSFKVRGGGDGGDGVNM
jgi:hypothetical protein